MGSRLFDEIREQRGLAYSVYSVDHAFADVPILQLSAGLESGKCVEAYARMREIVDELRTDGPTEEEVERARAYAAGRRVLAFENTNAVARHAAAQAVVYGDEVDPDAAIAVLDAVTLDEVVEVARGISEEASVACVGPARGRRVRLTAAIEVRPRAPRVERDLRVGADEHRRSRPPASAERRAASPRSSRRERRARSLERRVHVPLPARRPPRPRARASRRAVASSPAAADEDASAGGRPCGPRRRGRRRSARARAGRSPGAESHRARCRRPRAR